MIKNLNRWFSMIISLFLIINSVANSSDYKYEKEKKFNSKFNGTYLGYITPIKSKENKLLINAKKYKDIFKLKLDLTNEEYDANIYLYFRLKEIDDFMMNEMGRINIKKLELIDLLDMSGSITLKEEYANSIKKRSHYKLSIKNLKEMSLYFLADISELEFYLELSGIEDDNWIITAPSFKKISDVTPIFF